MSFGQDFISGFFGSGDDYLRDFQHASKTFRSNGYELAPRNKFLFHVYFKLNTAIPGIRDAFSAEEQSNIGILVKNISLPSYQFEVEELNQYNRKRLIQKKIKYQSVTTTFHDDGSDLIRRLWYNYFSYYYKDPSQKYDGVENSTTPAGFDYNNRDIYAHDRQVNDWGYFGEAFNRNTGESSKPPFFRDITIYGFNQKKWASYILINPLITEWKHDNYDYAQGNGIMENSITVDYETVKYMSGTISKDNQGTTVPGFGSPATYDTTPSPLARPGSTNTVLGQGGIVDTGFGVIQDLQNGNFLGAIRGAGALSRQVSDSDVSGLLRQEARQAAGAAAVAGAVGAVGAISSAVFTPVPRDTTVARENIQATTARTAPAVDPALGITGDLGPEFASTVETFPLAPRPPIAPEPL